MTLAGGSTRSDDLAAPWRSAGAAPRRRSTVRRQQRAEPGARAPPGSTRSVGRAGARTSAWRRRSSAQPLLRGARVRPRASGQSCRAAWQQARAASRRARRAAAATASSSPADRPADCRSAASAASV
ncbi:MAG: hypothetical protein MZW92_66925 [Comamonadaceae bacterium]|nr:hypothetical protein [Comamonadaceae bacterium]